MPITIDRPVRCLSQQEFGAVSYDVMRHAFEIQSDMGRFFDERIYQVELLRRLGDRAWIEVLIHASLADFSKPFRIDLLVDQGGIFEIKAVSKLGEQHRSQLIHYLMMTGLTHGKLINFRGEQIEHEFVNSHVTLETRRGFEIDTSRWNRDLPDAGRFQEVLTECLRDWGTGLDLRLYADAVTHFFGGLESVEQEIDVSSQGQRIGSHLVRLVNPATAFKLTSRNGNLAACESDLRRFLRHTKLTCIYWANITLNEVRLVQVLRD